MATDSSNLVRTTARGTMWTYAATYGGKALILVSTIILANLLSPQDFGIVGIALTVIAFLEVMQDLGLGSALIYHRDETAAHTAFWAGLLIGITLFVLTFVFAPTISGFFNEPRAIPIIRVLSLSFPLYALRNIHDALLRKTLAFKKRFIPDLAQVVCKGGLSIVLALFGFGPWSLVWGQIGGSALSVVGYWIVNPWRPQWHFDTKTTRTLLGYGTSLVAVNALAVVLAQSDYLLVGHYLGIEALGVYTWAFRLPDLMVMQFCVVIAQVMFPVYTRLRDDPNALQKGFLMTTRYVALITVPLSLGLALVSRPFVHTFLPERWNEAIPVMQAIAIYTLFLSLGFNAGDVYKAQGRPSILTKLSLVRIAMLLPALWWATTQGKSIVVVGWTHAVVAFIGSALNLIVAARMLKVSFASLVTAVRPAIVAGAIMALVVAGILVLLQAAPSFVQLLAAILGGAAAYSGSLWSTQRDVVQQAGQTLRGALARR